MRPIDRRQRRQSVSRAAALAACVCLFAPSLSLSQTPAADKLRAQQAEARAEQQRERDAARQEALQKAADERKEALEQQRAEREEAEAKAKEEARAKAAEEHKAAQEREAAQQRQAREEEAKVREEARAKAAEEQRRLVQEREAEQARAARQQAEARAQEQAARAKPASVHPGVIPPGAIVSIRQANDPGMTPGGGIPQHPAAALPVATPARAGTTAVIQSTGNGSCPPGTTPYDKNGISGAGGSTCYGTPTGTATVATATGSNGNTPPAQGSGGASPTSMGGGANNAGTGGQVGEFDSSGKGTNAAGCLKFDFVSGEAAHYNDSQTITNTCGFEIYVMRCHSPSTKPGTKDTQCNALGRNRFYQQFHLLSPGQTETNSYSLPPATTIWYGACSGGQYPRGKEVSLTGRYICQ